MQLTNSIVLNQYMVTVAIFSILLFVAFFAVIQLGKERDKENKLKIKKSRKRSIGKRTRYASSSIKNHLEHAISEKASVAKKYKIETICMQAGFQYSYGEYIILCLSVGIFLPILMLITIKNIYLTIIFAFIGFKAPGEYFKALANNRINKLDKQIGSFLKLILERYKNNKNIAQSLTQSLPDFKGLNPLYGILQGAVSDLQIGVPVEDVLDNMVRKTGNKYLGRFSDYYKMTGDLATHQSKVDLLNQSYEQYKEYCDMKQMLKERISGPVREAYIMVFATPAFMVYQSIQSEGYLDFMINNSVGQAGMAGIITILLLCIWFINAKIGAPIDM